jgi:hypothetical protein
MGRYSTIGNKILECFQVGEGQTEKKRLSLSQIRTQLSDISETSIKSAMDRLRGGDGALKRLRVVGYLTQVGHGGRSLPVFELGSDPDVPRTEEYVEDQSEEIARRRRDIRRALEDRDLQRQLAAIDNYE